MKNISLILLLFTAYVLSGCKSGSSSNNTLGVKESDAVCIWDNVSLLDSPVSNGKWISAISIGEKLTYLDESKEDTSGKKQVMYYKVQLKDNKTGWVRSDFIILGSKPAAISQDVQLYSRPDLLNKTDKMYKAMDIVAVKSEQGDFLEVTGKRQEGKWIESGWVKNSGVTYSDVDIAVAKYARTAMDIKDAKQREEKIKEIINNSEYSSSIFIPLLQGAPTEVKPGNMEEETPVDSTAKGD